MWTATFGLKTLETRTCTFCRVADANVFQYIEPFITSVTDRQTDRIAISNMKDAVMPGCAVIISCGRGSLHDSL